MKQRGKRIRPSGKDLVFHFTIASLLPVFLLVVGLFHVKTIQQINWQDFNLSQADKIDIPYLIISFSVAILICLLVAMLGTVVQAAGLVDDTVNVANEYSRYPLENYQLDFYVDNSWGWLPWNWSDGIGKQVMYGLYAITNFIWTISLYVSNATGYLVQELST